ncbi:hypothetical protein QE250_16810, partial [Chromatiaceae bacterium AAb-1]|nr:hypothetical protein [Chromatiaceae bacterium AAb-1]
MNSLLLTLCSELDALQGNMAKCKTVHLRYSMIPEHKSFLVRQAVLSIYSEWEGFIKKAISHYLQH